MHNVIVKHVLGLVVMQRQLLLLLAVVVVANPRHLAEPEHVDVVAQPQRQHDRLESRRVVEVLAAEPGVPLLDGGGAGGAGGGEDGERVPLDDAGAQRVEARVGDQQRRRRRPAPAPGDVHEVERSAHVGGHGDGDGDGDRAGGGAAGGDAYRWVVVAVAGAGDGGLGAGVEDVAVDEGERGLGADPRGVALGGRHVDPDHHVVGVDEGAVGGTREQHPAVAHHGARLVPLHGGGGGGRSVRGVVVGLLDLLLLTAAATGSASAADTGGCTRSAGGVLAVVVGVQGRLHLLQQLRHHPRLEPRLLVRPLRQQVPEAGPVSPVERPRQVRLPRLRLPLPPLLPAVALLVRQAVRLGPPQALARRRRRRRVMQRLADDPALLRLRRVHGRLRHQRGVHQRQRWGGEQQAPPLQGGQLRRWPAVAATGSGVVVHGHQRQQRVQDAGEQQHEGDAGQEQELHPQRCHHVPHQAPRVQVRLQQRLGPLG